MPVALIVAAAAIPLVHESKAHGDTRYDVPGVLLATLGLFSLVYGFTEAARLKNPDDPRSTDVQGWGDPSTADVPDRRAWCCSSRSCSGSAGRRNPMLPLRVVLDRNRGGSFLVFLLVGAGLFAMFLFLTYYFQVNLGYTPLKAGFAFLPFSLGIILTAGFVSQLLPRVGSEGADAARARDGRRRDAAADPDRPGLVVLGAGASRRWSIMSVGLAGVFIPAASTVTRRSRAATTRASPPRCSTPRSRSAARSARRC